MEQDALAEDPRDGYRYFMRTDPAMREMMGPIERVEDELTGREMRRRWFKVAPIRGMDLTNVNPRWVYLDPLPHIRIDKGQDLRGWYSARGDGDLRGQRDRPCMTDAILTQPYGGYCSVGCTFCYINSGSKGYRGSGLVSVPMGYAAQVERQLKRMSASAAGYFSSFTDPFLPLEGFYHNTRDASRKFVEAGLPIFYLSRLSYPGWAFDNLRENPLSYMQKSINCSDQDDWERLSPGAMPLLDHMDEIRQARVQGTYVSIQVNPIVPGIVTHDDVEDTLEMLAEAGTNHVIVKFVEANHPWAAAMVERITKRFGENRAAAFRDLFTENQCGGQRTVAEEYRRAGHERYRARATRLGMTYATCYEYGRDPTRRGGWRSIGADYLTADQCHGHRVPMHRRVSTEPLRFEPLDECPPSGCLTCETGACGSEVLHSALALKLTDLARAL